MGISSRRALDLEIEEERIREAAPDMLAALRETLAEAIEHRKDIIEARAADFQGIADQKFRQAYDQEIARFDALIDRARAAIAKATGAAS